MSKQTVRIGITFSGGGARGIAHIGVLRALEENGIYPDVVAGTSAGSVVGALYAAGLSPEQMMDFVRDTSILKIFKAGFPLAGLSKLSYLRERLEQFIPDDRFEALQRKLYVAATNLNTGKLEILEKGPLFKAVMASSAIPLVFHPVEIDGQFYVDGGLLENLPIRPLVYADVDIIIGVNVMPLVKATPKSVQTVLGIASRVFDLAIQANTRPCAELCNVFIEPWRVNAFHIFQFNKHQELQQIGYDAAMEKMELIKEMILEMSKRKQKASEKTKYP